VRGAAEDSPLRSVSFALAPGSFHAVAGAQGSGKGQLLKLAALAARPSQGMVQLFGRDVATLTPRDAALIRRRIGAVTYPLKFIDHLSVWDNAALGPRATGRKASEYAAQIDAVLMWMGLARRAGARPGALSAAERHRLALARAVANRPELLLVDAPDAPLEPAEAERIHRLVDDIWAAGATVLAVRREGETPPADRPVLRLQEGRAILVEPLGA
jgi:cell division transport system ATP-binding protein